MRVVDSYVLTVPVQKARYDAFRDWEIERPWPEDVPRAELFYGVQGTSHAIGVAQSHANILYRLAALSADADEGAGFSLVMEDDCRWGDEFERAWPTIRDSIPPDAEIVFLGGAHDTAFPPDASAARVVPARKAYRLHMYLVRRTARTLVKLARMAEATPGLHVDVVWAEAMERGEVAAYAANPFLAAQKTGDHWYAWNVSEGPVKSERALKIYARYALGVPSENQPRLVVYGLYANEPLVKRLDGLKLLAIEPNEIAVLTGSAESREGARHALETFRTERVDAARAEQTLISASPGCSTCKKTGEVKS